MRRPITQEKVDLKEQPEDAPPQEKQSVEEIEATPPDLEVARQPVTDRELRAYGEQIGELRGFQTNLKFFIAIAAIIATFIIAALGWLGFSGVINNVVAGRVNTRVEEAVGQFVVEMEARLASAESAASRAENAAGRAESAADFSSGAAATAQAVSFELQATATQSVIAGAVGDFTVVVSSREQLPDALVAAENVVQDGYDPTIYKVGDFYIVTVGRFQAKQLAQEFLVEARAKLHPTSYLLILADACPYTLYYQSGFYGCFLSPQE